MAEIVEAPRLRVIDDPKSARPASEIMTSSQYSRTLRYLDRRFQTVVTPDTDKQQALGAEQLKEIRSRVVDLNQVDGNDQIAQVLRAYPFHDVMTLVDVIDARLAELEGDDTKLIYGKAIVKGKDTERPASWGSPAEELIKEFKERQPTKPTAVPAFTATTLPNEAGAVMSTESVPSIEKVSKTQPEDPLVLRGTQEEYDQIKSAHTIPLDVPNWEKDAQFADIGFMPGSSPVKLGEKNTYLELYEKDGATYVREISRNGPVIQLMKVRKDSELYIHGHNDTTGEQVREIGSNHGFGVIGFFDGRKVGEHELIYLGGTPYKLDTKNRTISRASKNDLPTDKDRGYNRGEVLVDQFYNEQDDSEKLPKPLVTKPAPISEQINQTEIVDPIVLPGTPEQYERMKADHTVDPTSLRNWSQDTRYNKVAFMKDSKPVQLGGKNTGFEIYREADGTKRIRQIMSGGPLAIVIQVNRADQELLRDTYKSSPVGFVNNPNDSFPIKGENYLVIESGTYKYNSENQSLVRLSEEDEKHLSDYLSSIQRILPYREVVQKGRRRSGGAVKDASTNEPAQTVTEQHDPSRPAGKEESSTANTREKRIAPQNTLGVPIKRISKTVASISDTVPTMTSSIHELEESVDNELEADQTQDADSPSDEDEFIEEDEQLIGLPPIRNGNNGRKGKNRNGHVKNKDGVDLPISEGLVLSNNDDETVMLMKPKDGSRIKVFTVYGTTADDVTVREFVGGISQMKLDYKNETIVKRDETYLRLNPDGDKFIEMNDSEIAEARAKYNIE